MNVVNPPSTVEGVGRRRPDRGLSPPATETAVVSGEDALTFQRDGFLVVRGVFTAQEVRSLRDAVASFAAGAKARGHVLRPLGDEIVPVGDIVGVPDLGWLVSDPRIGRLARALVGRDDLVYFGDSGVMVGGERRGFHKDNTVRDDANDADWSSPYTLVRFGIYLEDHERHSGGLKVRRGSHQHADVTTGSIVDVPTRAGDVVVWSLRTTHSGHAVRVRGLPFLRLQPRFEGRLPQFLRIPSDGRRLAAFLTLGTDDAHLRRYVAKHADLSQMPDNYLYKSWLHSDGSSTAAQQLADAGITLLKAVPDYGAKFGDQTAEPAGFISTRAGRSDVYPARGMEAWIQRGGAALRALRVIG